MVFMQNWVKGIDVKRLESPKMKGPNLGCLKWEIGLGVW